MNSKKVFYILLAVLILTFAGAIAGTLYGTKALKKSGDDLLALKLEHAALQSDEETLKKAKADIEKHNELEQVAKALVPQEKDQARTIRELVSIAEQTGVIFDSITFPASDLGGTSGAKSKKSTAPNGITQLAPVEGLSGVYAMPITVQSSVNNPVTYTRLLEFLKRIEQNRRTSHVTNITITPDTKNGNLVSFNLQINAYIKP